MNEVFLGKEHIAAVCPSREGAIDGTEPECFRCDGRGHRKAECPLIIRTGQCCYTCGLPGHFARDCPLETKFDYNHRGKRKVKEWENQQLRATQLSVKEGSQNYRVE